METKIPGMKEAYKDALSKHKHELMDVDPGLIVDMVDYICELENAVTDFRTLSMACANTSTSVLRQYKDL